MFCGLPDELHCTWPAIAGAQHTCELGCSICIERPIHLPRHESVQGQYGSLVSLLASIRLCMWCMYYLMSAFHIRPDPVSFEAHRQAIVFRPPFDSHIRCNQDRHAVTSLAVRSTCFADSTVTDSSALTVLVLSRNSAISSRRTLIAI